MARYQVRSNGQVYCSIRRKGYKLNKTFRNKTAARAWAEPIEAKIDDGLMRRVGNHSLHDALDRYADEISANKKGARWEMIRLERFSREFDDIELWRVTPAMLAKWRDERLESVTPGTVRREINLLSAVFSVAKREWGWVETNPFQDVKRPTNNKSRTVYIRPAERNQLNECAGYTPGQNCITSRQYACAAMELACNTAMRLNEIVQLEWSEIDMDNRTAYLPETKNGLAREIPLNRAAIAILEGLEGNERPFVKTRDCLSQVFSKMKNEIGLSHIHFHDSRATAITNFASKVNINTLARISGHKDLSMLQRYYRRSMSDIAGDLD